VRLRGAHSRRTRRPRCGRRRVGPMSTLPRIAWNVADQWPSEYSIDDGGSVRGDALIARAASGDTLGQLLLASRLLGADRALANFGGGNTSAKGTAIDHVGREVRVMWVKGSGSDLAIIGERDFVRLQLDEILPLFERDEM